MLTTNKRLSWPLNAHIYVDKYNLLFCPIAKNACTSLKYLMLEIAGIVKSAEELMEDAHVFCDSLYHHIFQHQV